MSYEWHWEVVGENLPFLLEGLKTTFALAVIIMILGSILGLVLAVIRTTRTPVLTQFATGYVEFFRTTPLYTQLVWLYLCLPLITGIAIPRFETAVIAFSLNLAAFQSEIFRAGVLSISKGQTEAAMAIGMTRMQAMRRIILPQAVSRVVPPTASNWIGLFKDTAIVSLIAVQELMFRGRVMAVNSYRPLEIFTAVALIYFLATYPQSLLVDHLHHRYRVVE